MWSWRSSAKLKPSSRLRKMKKPKPRNKASLKSSKTSSPPPLFSPSPHPQNPSPGSYRMTGRGSRSSSSLLPTNKKNKSRKRTRRKIIKPDMKAGRPIPKTIGRKIKTNSHDNIVKKPQRILRKKLSTRKSIPARRNQTKRYNMNLSPNMLRRSKRRKELKTKSEEAKIYKFSLLEMTHSTRMKSTLEGEMLVSILKKQDRNFKIMTLLFSKVLPILSIKLSSWPDSWPKTTPNSSKSTSLRQLKLEFQAKRHKKCKLEAPSESSWVLNLTNFPSNTWAISRSTKNRLKKKSTGKNLKLLKNTRKSQRTGLRGTKGTETKEDSRSGGGRTMAMTTTGVSDDNLYY